MGLGWNQLLGTYVHLGLDWNCGMYHAGFAKTAAAKSPAFRCPLVRTKKARGWVSDRHPIPWLFWESGLALD